MKKLSFYSLLMALGIMLSITSCSKEGDMGPEGPQGPKGETGAQGIPGTDGNLLLYGNVPPLDSEGNLGITI